jgi:hypothetical protein
MQGFCLKTTGFNLKEQSVDKKQITKRFAKCKISPVFMSEKQKK